MKDLRKKKKETELGTLYLHYYLRIYREASSKIVFVCIRDAGDSILWFCSVIGYRGHWMEEAHSLVGVKGQF